MQLICRTLGLSAFARQVGGARTERAPQFQCKPEPVAQTASPRSARGRRAAAEAAPWRACSGSASAQLPGGVAGPEEADAVAGDDEEGTEETKFGERISEIEAMRKRALSAAKAGKLTGDLDAEMAALGAPPPEDGDDRDSATKARRLLGCDDPGPAGAAQEEVIASRRRSSTTGGLGGSGVLL